MPAGGCTGEAGRELMHGAPVPPHPQLAKRLSLQSFARTKQEGHVKRSLQVELRNATRALATP